MFNNEYNALPTGYASRTTSNLEPIHIGGMFMSRQYTVDETLGEVEFFTEDDSGGRLCASKPFLQPFSDGIINMKLDEHSFRSSFESLKHIVSTPIRHYSARTILNNCIRTLRVALHRYDEGKMSPSDAATADLQLDRVFKATAQALAEVPVNALAESLPPSFVSVTEELQRAVNTIKIPSLLGAIFDEGSVLEYPLVIHPALDLATEALQRCLKTICDCYWNQYSLEVTFTELLRALGAVNTSLFLNGQDALAKNYGFVINIDEFRRLYLRHQALKHTCQWIAIKLIGPYWLNEFKEICRYLAKTVGLITGQSFDLNTARVNDAVAHDLTILADCWRSNIALADLERCRNPRTCEALVDVGQWASLEVHTAGDREGGLFAAREAWRLAQRAIPGSYEYLALMHAMYELRRCLQRSSLEQWEFAPTEIELGNLLGEGGFATVMSCGWFGGKAAVKTFRRESPSVKGSSTTLTTEGMKTYLHRRELEVWYRLSHPHVLPFLGACLTGSTPMILTPLCEHGNARSYRSKHPDVDWLDILIKIVSGVDFLHTQAKIVHGDLKGANILINSQVSPQIADFGLAKMTENIYGHRESVGGTVQWMAPELLSQTGHLNYESDIYALGMTLYELWYNKDPFELLEPDLVQEMVLEEELRPEREDSPAMGEVLWSAIEECWHTDPKERPNSSILVELLGPSSNSNPRETTNQISINPETRLVPLPNLDEAAANQESQSIENISCTHLHEPVNFPQREPFPFISSRHLVSFGVETQKTFYMYVTDKGHLHCETSQNAIPPHGTVNHPVERLIFRIQTVTYRDGIKWREKCDFPGPSRFEGVLFRRSEDAAGSWTELQDERAVILDVDPRCNSTVAHQVELDNTSPIIQHALAGDKVGLKVLVDSGYRCRVDYAEIEIHVRLDSQGTT